MAGKFVWLKFEELDLEERFFEALKADYEGFSTWFEKKSETEEQALVFSDEEGMGAFLYLKQENEAIVLENQTLPAMPRLKIGSLNLAERVSALNLGDGALGVALWQWQALKYEEVYFTVFEKHAGVIDLFKKFGFKCVGVKANGEQVYVKRRGEIAYEDAYKAFPFIKSDFERAGIIPMFERFHDRLLPYSELKDRREMEEETAGNGITKVYVTTPSSVDFYEVGEPVGIYRIYEGDKAKLYRSAVTSYCTITKIEIIKDDERELMSLEDFIEAVEEKTIFTVSELTNMYDHRANVVMLEMVYNGFFEKGHNVIHKNLVKEELFPKKPYNIEFNKDQFVKLLEMGEADVSNIIID